MCPRPAGAAPVFGHAGRAGRGGRILSKPSNEGPTLRRDVLVDLPKGTVASIVTYLDMTPRHVEAPAERPGLAHARLRGGDVDRYRAIYRRLGERWLWWSRLEPPRPELAAILDDPRVEAMALTEGGADVGLVELDFRPEEEAELAFFGLTEEAIGRGLGRWMMRAALARAFARPIRRLFVHTCTFDHPGALDFYRRSGFRPYKRAVEYADDPRLGGVLPRASAPHVPLLAAGDGAPDT